MEAGKREQIMDIMFKHGIDLLALQETKVSSSSEECKTRAGSTDRCTFYFSSIPNREKTEQERRRIHGARAQTNNNRAEHHGVGFVVCPKLSSCIKDCIPHSSRIIEIQVYNHGPDLCFISHYAPHSGRKTEEKHQHWENLQQLVDGKGEHIPIYILATAMLEYMDDHARPKSLQLAHTSLVMVRYTYSTCQKNREKTGSA